MKPSIARWTGVAAFSLVEVALAMGLASFCLITVVALVPLGVSTGQMASDQSAAGSILTHVLADLRATPMTSPPGSVSAKSMEYAVVIPPAGTTTPTSGATPSPQILYFGNSAQEFSFAQGTGTAPVSSRYRLAVTFFPPASGSRAATGVALLVTWPPQVNPSTGTPTGHVQIYAGLDRN